jgi:hypothetical protein
MIVSLDESRCFHPYIMFAFPSPQRRTPQYYHALQPTRGCLPYKPSSSLSCVSWGYAGFIGENTETDVSRNIVHEAVGLSPQLLRVSMEGGHLPSPASLRLTNREEAVSLHAALVLAILDAIWGKMDKVAVLFILLVGHTGNDGVGKLTSWHRLYVDQQGLHSGCLGSTAMAAAARAATRKMVNCMLVG